MRVLPDREFWCKLYAESDLGFDEDPKIAVERASPKRPNGIQTQECLAG